MHRTSKRALFLSSIGVMVISVAAGIIFSPLAGFVVAFGTTIASLFWAIFSLIYDTWNELKSALEQFQLEIRETQQELGTRAGLPLVAQYLQLQDERCPLFKYAADQVYQEALEKFSLLHRNELHMDNLEQVYRVLEFLFHNYGSLKEIKAVSSGEFAEWLATDSWWNKHYMKLHELAHDRGIQIERTYIVKSNNQAKTYDKVFQRNVKYHVRLKIALSGRVSQADHQVGNCMLFYTERREPVYALVAHHNHQGGCEHIIIYRDPQRIKHIVEAYERIDSISRPYSGISFSNMDQFNKMVSQKSG